MKNYFKILGLPANKSIGEKEIKQAYRSLALIWHPDKNPQPGAKEKFIEIDEACKELLDPVTRNALLTELEKATPEVKAPERTSEVNLSQELDSILSSFKESKIEDEKYCLAYRYIIKKFLPSYENSSFEKKPTYSYYYGNFFEEEDPVKAKIRNVSLESISIYFINLALEKKNLFAEFCKKYYSDRLTNVLKLFLGFTTEAVNEYVRLFSIYNNPGSGQLSLESYNKLHDFLQPTRSILRQIKTKSHVESLADEIFKPLMGNEYPKTNKGI